MSVSRSLLESLFAAGDSGDLDAFDQLLHEDVVVHAPAGLSTRGRDAERESWRKARAAMIGLHHEFVDVLATPELEAARTVVTGTFSGTYGGLTAQGRPFRFDQAVFAHVRGGKISELWEIVDVSAVKAQLERAGDA